MQDTDVQELILKIIEQAQENIHTEFNLVDSWAEYVFYREQRRSLKVVLKVLRESTDNIFKTYCKEIPKGTANVTSLLAYRQLLDVIDYYDLELKIIHEMILEYTDYLTRGHFITSLLGESRSRGT